MLRTILVIMLMLGLSVVGRMGGGLIHLLMAVATVFLVVQLIAKNKTMT